jgi:WD40 repeat protein
VTVDGGGWSDLLVFDTASRKLLWKHELASSASALALSPDGRFLAIAFSSRPKGCPHVAMLDASSGRAAVPLEDQGALSSLRADSAFAVTFSEDSAHLAASLDNAVRLWDAASGKNALAIEPPGFDTPKGVEKMRDLAFSPDGQRIAGAVLSRPLVHIWSAVTGKLDVTLGAPGFNGSLSSIVFAPAGDRLAAGSTGPLFVWRTAHTSAPQVPLQIPKPAAGPIGPITFLDGDGRLLVDSPTGLQMWRVAKIPPQKDPTWRASGVTPDTVFRLAGGKLMGVVSDTQWKHDPTAPANLKLLDVMTGETIADLAAPGRDAKN